MPPSKGATASQASSQRLSCRSKGLVLPDFLSFWMGAQEIAFVCGGEGKQIPHLIKARVSSIINCVIVSCTIKKEHFTS